MYEHQGDGRCDLAIAQRPTFLANLPGKERAAAEELRCALGRLLAGTARPGEICAAIEQYGPLLYRADRARLAGEERELDNAD